MNALKKYLIFLTSIAGIAGIFLGIFFYSSERTIEGTISFCASLVSVIITFCCASHKKDNDYEITTHENEDATNLYEQLNAQKRQIQEQSKEITNLQGQEAGNLGSEVINIQELPPKAD
jgi:hypothetical protein